MSDTIYALSSGQPPAAIALVRISGPAADFALRTLAGHLPEPRVATLARLHWKGELLDNALVLRFRGPNSATGEDVAELHLHGGRSVVAATLAALSEVDGLRPAAPGEFTRRAFEQGRIDLAEAEGLADLLEAETESQRRNALLLAGGALSRQVESWQQRLLQLAGQVEAALDFSDEDDVAPLTPTFAVEWTALREELAEWLRRPAAERLKDGVRVVIAGPPNAGKSSLLNVLAGREAAITAASPGTTRDVIEIPLALAGTPFLLADTAGLRETTDEVETIGVVRARTIIEAADLILWLGDPRLAPPGAIRVHAKADLGSPAAEVDVQVSARTGAGLDELVRLMIHHSSRLLPREGEVSLNARQRGLIEVVEQALGEADGESDLLILSEALRGALKAVDRITGRAGVEDMLDTLFERFCIGK
ncbi:MAG TPA: tRNA uridine-5-carboxymethylaminomethyl(34) synthesis GTPase MnmE [Allosphingosinicella sp.]|nr:tRNA uridine-5-carboxymethylaminomethyl(34) synthesis GTPase MnmE [Allosphingosinicella sp.]